MTQIVLEIDNEKDKRLFMDLAKRLNVRFKTAFSTTNRTKKKKDITAQHLHSIIQNGKGLDFLEADAENIYTDGHLKVKF